MLLLGVCILIFIVGVILSLYNFFNRFVFIVVSLDKIIENFGEEFWFFLLLINLVSKLEKYLCIFLFFNWYLVFFIVFKVNFNFELFLLFIGILLVLELIFFIKLI